MKYGLIKLAPESPLRKSSDILYDDSSYDSFHNYETGEFVALLPFSLNGKFSISKRNIEKKKAETCPNVH